MKLEVDNPNLEGFLPPPPSSSTQNQTSPHDTPASNNDSGSAAAAEIVELNNTLAGQLFLDKLCLAKLRLLKDAGSNEYTSRWWPALEYSNQKEFRGDVKSFELKIKLADYFKQHPLKGAIAFLLGMQTIEESIIALGEDMVDRCENHIKGRYIDKLLKEDGYKDNETFKEAVAIVGRRIDELCYTSNEDDDEDDDIQSNDGTVAFDSGYTPPSPSSSNQASSSPSLDDQASASHSSTNQVNTIEDAPAKSGGKDNKRKGKSKNDGTASKKKKTSKQTPKSKSRGTQPPMVTPLPSKSGDKEISKHLRVNCFEPHKVMKHEDAWKLLEARYGFSCEDGKYYLPSTFVSNDCKPVAASLMGLREDLCEKGLPESIQPLSTDEKIDIARWVRYAHVKGLENGQKIKPDDLRQPTKFMHKAAWPILRDNFGCSYNGGTYNVKVPRTPHGEEIKAFQRTSGVDEHFARFGIQCIPDDPGDILSREDRLRIELFFATPSFEVLNTL